MENAIKNSSKLNFCETAAEPPLSRRMVCLPAAERSAFRRLSVFPGSSYDVIISIGGHAVNNGVENRKRRKAY